MLSEVLARPGATQSVFDVLAGSIHVLAPHGRVALLGFAGGGLVAPLRAMGWDGALAAVDLSLSGERVFRRYSRTWSGRVRVTRCEAGRWLRRGRRRFDLLLEDLSVHGPQGTTKPESSFKDLPRLVRSRLSREGIAVFNLLPTTGRSWSVALEAVRAPFPLARVVVFDAYENRVVVAGTHVPSATLLSRSLRASLRSIDSSIADAIRVENLPRSPGRG